MPDASILMADHTPTPPFSIPRIRHLPATVTVPPGYFDTSLLEGNARAGMHGSQGIIDNCVPYMYIISFRMIVSKYLTGSVLKLACNANCKVVSNVPLSSTMSPLLANPVGKSQ